MDDAAQASGIPAKLVEAFLKIVEETLKPEETSQSARLTVLDLTIDTGSKTVFRDGEVIDLPELSFRLLETLVSRAPDMLAKDQLIQEVWGDVVVSDETLAQRVRLLRQAIGDDSQKPRYIGAVRGRGYRFIAPVTTEASKKPDEATPSSSPFRRWWPAIAAVALVCVAVFLANQSDDSTAPVSRLSTIAVLPFSDISEDQSFGYFADGMQEELLTRLADIDEIAVLSRTSVERYRGTTDSIPDIADELNATAIIEGSVRLSGDRLRISVQLIDGASDEHLWANNYEEELTVENVFRIQESVAISIAEALRVESLQQPAATGLPTADTEAYDLYLLGRHHAFRQTTQSLALAVTYLERAVARDPEFAEAYAALGWAYAFLGTQYGQISPRAAYPKAREAALRALELDDQLADAHSLYADILTWYDWDFDLAEIEHRRAMALDPRSVLGYALFLSSQSRHDEAIAILEARLAIAPEDEYLQVNAGWRYYHAGHFRKAIESALNAETHPDSLTLLGYSQLALRNFRPGIAALEKNYRQKGQSAAGLAQLAYANIVAGNGLEAAEMLQELSGRTATGESASALATAAIAFAAGDEDRGFGLLELAVEGRERGVIFLKVSPVFAAYRDDPRFEEIVARVGLSTEATSAQ